MLEFTVFIWGGGGVMVFNTTFNNISVIWWRSVFGVEETKVHVPGENHRPVAITTLVEIGTDCIDSCKSN
jgi:hypothetical protein